MNLAPATLAAALAVAPPPPAAEPAEPEYALPPLSTPCVATPCGGALLSDLELTLGEPGGPRRGAARLLLGDRLYLGLSADEARRGLALSTARWDVDLEHRDDRAGISAEFRGSRLRLAARAEDFRRAAGGGWRFALETALRLGPDLEIVAAALSDERSNVPSGPPLRTTASLSLGTLWQRGARFELAGRWSSATLETPGGFELDRQGVVLEATYQAQRWRLGGGLGLDELSGRFDRREGTAKVDFRYRLTGHLVAQAAAAERYEIELGSIERRLGASLTYYARRFRFARTGSAAARTVELAHRAWELGLNESRLHDLEGRRRLRQRLALTRHGDELAPLIEELHRAQIDERNVPLAGIALRHGRDNLDGSRVREEEVFLAIPWPRRSGPHPLRHDEAATDFLRFSYRRTEREISTGFSTEGTLLAAEVALRRELSLRFAWDDPAGTGLQFALGTQEPRQFSAQLVYRQGI